MTPALSVRVDALLSGKALKFTRAGSISAIAKHPLAGEVRIGELGIEGDEQGDLRVHGGIDKALHHYAFEHYAQWRNELGDLPLLQTPGAFGENISTHGLSEADVCLGDRYQLGSAVLEVSQGRQPCWKLNDRFGVAGMAKRVQTTGRSGWYYRVLQAGTASPGDVLTRLECRHPDWPLARLAQLLYTRVLDPALLEPALALPLLPSWRKLIERRLQYGAVEDWGKRIDGPSQSA
ncbi:MAG TPA: MOSC domain-containing protein [Thermomonas sp.]|jgi:MOSC domain-containing protein YiiM|nr:MOSC domain-containing protein [Thermomonas sp.]HQY50145.1 MOSC domain-containing protein [Thermomonas sp.]HRA57025.1 MOSC domain-containing protein [Thermomonas sp.]